MQLMYDQARQYLARVVPWPTPEPSSGEATFYVNVHWTFKGTNQKPGDKPLWTGRACTNLNEAIHTVQFAAKGSDTRDIYACMSGPDHT